MHSKRTRLREPATVYILVTNVILNKTHINFYWRMVYCCFSLYCNCVLDVTIKLWDLCSITQTTFPLPQKPLQPPWNPSSNTNSLGMGGRRNDVSAMQIGFWHNSGQSFDHLWLSQRNKTYVLRYSLYVVLQHVELEYITCSRGRYMWSSIHHHK